MLLQMGPLLCLGPKVITDGTFITLGSKSYYRWDLYYAWVHLLHLCLLQASRCDCIERHCSIIITCAFCSNRSLESGGNKCKICNFPQLSLLRKRRELGWEQNASEAWKRMKSPTDFMWCSSVKMKWQWSHLCAAVQPVRACATMLLGACIC